MNKPLPFRVSAAASRRIREAPIGKQKADLAFHIGESQINGIDASESIHLCGYQSGTLDPVSFYDFEGVKISLPEEVLSVLRGRELVLEERILADGLRHTFYWIK